MTRGAKLRALKRATVGISITGTLALGCVIAVASNDPLFAQQWGLSGQTSSINAPQAWCATTGAGILVADVDTGVDFSHPDLTGRLVAGARFTGGTGTLQSSGDPSQLGDGVGHGTGTTGVMVANKDDRIGIAGVAPSAQALVVKVFDDQGSGYTNDAAAGIRWAADNGARVINLSLGGDPTGGLGVHVSLVPDANMVNAIQYAAGKHVAVAVSAGNNQAQVPVSQYIQIAQVALVVGAVGPAGEPGWYTTTGAGVNIYAPGGDDPNGTGSTAINVVTPYKGGRWVAWQGTSFAAPHVAGTLALLMSRGMSAEAARQKILDTAVSRGTLPQLDAAAALGTSGGCASAPAATNDGGAANPTAARSAASGTRSTSPSRSTAGAAPPGAPGAVVALASPSATASPSPSASTAPSQDSMPSPKTLAHEPVKKGSQSPPAALIVLGLGVLGAAGYGGFRLVQSLK
ncbi:MAG: S8 family serine peptidase [Candidatus Dormibacteria bacterium]